MTTGFLPELDVGIFLEGRHPPLYLIPYLILEYRLLHVTVDLGHPDRFHHLIPPFGIESCGFIKVLHLGIP